MSVRHRSLAAGRWFEMTFLWQMANVGSEVERAITRRSRGDTDHSAMALERAFELLGLTIADRRNCGRLRELCRVREALADYFYADNQYGSTDRLWQNYFRAFAWAAQARRGR